MKRQRGRPAAASVPSPQTRFEMRIRANGRLNVTGRLLWLLTALSHRRGYTFMSEADTAQQLRTTERQVGRSLRYITASSDAVPLFRQVRPIGVHRPRQYHRVLLPGEDADEFVYRAQADRRFDATVRLHWVASALTAETASAEFSARDLGASEAALRRARRRMEDHGHFRVESGQERGRPARYTRLEQEQDRARVKNELVAGKSNADPRPAAAGRASATAERRVPEPVHRESEDAARLRDLAMTDMGMYEPVRPVRRPEKKRRITSFNRTSQEEDREP